MVICSNNSVLFNLSYEREHGLWRHHFKTNSLHCMLFIVKDCIVKIIFCIVYRVDHLSV